MILGIVIGILIWQVLTFLVMAITNSEEKAGYFGTGIIYLILVFIVKPIWKIKSKRKTGK